MSGQWTRALLSGVMALAYMTPEIRLPHHWEAANNTSKPPRKAKTDRAKAKAARKQNRNRK